MSLLRTYGSNGGAANGRVDGGNNEDDAELTLYEKDIVEINGTPGELQLLIGKPNKITGEVHHELAELIYHLFTLEHHHSHNHPRTTPQLPPVRRGKRHRNYYVWCSNQFRHWWKTSRLLVRLSGGLVYCQDMYNWHLMALWDVSKIKQAKHSLKQMKNIGQGGTSKLFLNEVHKFTRSLRIFLAIARAWEAKVDNRLYEVGIAEGMAFMGNRCFRYWSRFFTDAATKHIMYPLSAAFLAPYLDQHSRPITVVMGFIRGILPFAMSFQGSRFGRQLTFNTYKYANYRWKPTQSIMHFHEKAGNYRETNLDPHLLALARSVAEAIGHGVDPEETRLKLENIGFAVFGSGSGGYSVYRKIEGKAKIIMHVTPYGPSILDEMPRFILIERRVPFYAGHLMDPSDAMILDAATPREAKVRGYTYSGAFFQAQEWAALKARYDRELNDYSEACRIYGTLRLPKHKRNPQETHQPAPPTDLQSLKAFLRSGRQNFRQHRDDMRWKQIVKEIRKMAKLVAKYQNVDRAPTRVILYLEGLDCSGKSSTGMLIIKALEECGYSVGIAQHNRPPTPEQRKKPWMDRIRFEYPEDMYESEDKCPDYASLVWDRGPAGDFVYGPLYELPVNEKLKRYREFRTYDFNCRAQGVLFFKCFFVTDRDKIAATLGKRLAHKKIARDLRTWLDANSVAQIREGLEEIELHIDPTDFIAFNKYEENLHKFAEFVRNTDRVGHVGGQADTSITYDNEWLVINTANRHAARLSMMRAFRKQLHDFAYPPSEREDFFSRIKRRIDPRARQNLLRQSVTLRPVPNNIVEEKEHGLSARALLQSFLLFLLFYAYAYQTWNFNIDDIT